MRRSIPIGVLLMMLIGLNSWRRSVTTGVTWKGRVYKPRCRFGHDGTGRAHALESAPICESAVSETCRSELPRSLADKPFTARALQFERFSRMLANNAAEVAEQRADAPSVPG